MKEKILIIDDEKNICASLTYALEDDYIVFSETNPSKGIEIINNNKINLVLLDLKIGRVDGLDVLREIKDIDSKIVVIMMTAYGTIETSVEAMKNGAYTYLTKPLNIDELVLTIEQALEYQGLFSKVDELNNQLKEKYSYKGIIGKSKEMLKIFELIEKIKDVDVNVLITGESGTGKEVVARAIHYSGKYSREKFVEINCAAIPEGLLESELFGHKKGAFTGADKDKIGKLEYAGKGTILLDEIGDMSLNLQSKLLRVIEQKEFSPIGSNEVIKTEARIIAATNKDLMELIDSNDFRLDLYYRLNVINIKLPPLRHRKGDLPLLFEHFIKLYNDKFGKNVEKLSSEAESLLLKYSYPGNVRELSNIIERAVLLSEDGIITESAIPNEVKINASLDLENISGLTLKAVEKKVIEATLKINKGKRKETAEMLGISERGLRNKIKEYNLK
ncbi:MAG: sigma-54-dependent Fis family transcriptional regulator [Tissierellia bacterium]|nr:sigma-54-dependent Fis family transcriptional regulator [Tissierellia bacterium]